MSTRSGKPSKAAQTTNASARAIQAGAASYVRRGRGASAARYGMAGGGLQCVPFARENSGIEIMGNANTWWDSADGIYERGRQPEVGSVLNFRANGRMRMGHVAVVSRVVNSRAVEIDHANWSGPGVGRGRITRDIDVVDVSPHNDWTAVRVAVGDSDMFGSVYPTYGFIYDRPDRGTMVAHANAGAAPMPELNAPIRDLRPANERVLVSLGAEQDVEVADAGDDQPRVRSTYRRSARGTAAQQRGARVTQVRGTANRNRATELRPVTSRSQLAVKPRSQLTRPRT